MLRTKIYGPPMTPIPNWVFEMYDVKILVERVHDLLTSLRLFSHAKVNSLTALSKGYLFVLFNVSFFQVSVPSDPEELSFWVAWNLPLTDKHRYRILEFDCAVQRLRYELGLFKKVNGQIFWTLKLEVFTTSIFQMCRFRSRLLFVITARPRLPPKTIYFPCLR